MFSAKAAYLAPVVALLSFGLQSKGATAQTIYPFNATYTSESSVVPITGNVSRLTIVASSTDAPYGLTKFVNTNYGSINPSTGEVVFNPDTSTFGLKDLPLGGLTISGAGNDKLFGNIIGTSKLDFQSLTGTLLRDC